MERGTSLGKRVLREQLLNQHRVCWSEEIEANFDESIVCRRTSKSEYLKVDMLKYPCLKVKMDAKNKKRY